MSNHPSELYYTSTHEWLRDEGNHVYTVGITDHAQSLLGDIVFVELPELESDVDEGDEVAVVESVKTASDVYSPVAGEVIGINDALIDSPGAINRDPYGDGWLFRIRVGEEVQLDNFLDVAHYEEKISE